MLATELGSEALLMDDGDGIRFAVAAGANVIRTPGIYRLAKQRQFIAAIRPKLDDLRRPDFGYATNTIASSLRALANSAILN